ncbi:retrovirus-related pol polyprotein from transposon TNT 1-94 [Tanacetum coccineum]
MESTCYHCLPKKDLHTADYSQLYDFLKYNQKEVNGLRAEQLARTHDPLALMTNSNNPYNYPGFHQDQPSPITYMQQPPPKNNYNPQPSFNQNYMQQPMINPDDISDPTTAMNMALNPGVLNVRNQNGLVVVPGIASPNVNQNGNGNVVAAWVEGNGNMNNINQIRCYNCRGLGHLARNCTIRPGRMDAAYLQTQFLIAQKEEVGIQLQAKEFELMVVVEDLDEIEEVNANCILMANLQASTSGTQTDNALVYDSDGSAEVIQICLWYIDSGCSNHMTRNLKHFINFFWKFLGTVRFRNDHVTTILGYGDLQWGNILITRVYFFEGLGHNLFSVGQFCNSDLEVAFKRNTYFIRNLEGVYLLKGNRTTNLYTINLHEMASASPICLMARATPTKSWLWHQRLSHLNFDTINNLAKNNLVISLLKFKYHKEHLCPSCEQGKSKKLSHPPKQVPNSKKRLHLHMDLCGPIRVESINGKRLKGWLLRATLKTALSFTVNLTKHHTSSLTAKKPDIYYLKNDREDIGKLGAKGDIGFFIGYSANSCAYRVYNQRTKKIMEIMNVIFDELSAMAFEQSSSKLGL